MFNSKLKFFLLLLLFLSVFINPQHADARRTVRVGIYNFKPLVNSDANGAVSGFFVEILKHVADKQEWNLQYIAGTWQDGLDRLKNDQIDLMVCIGYTEEREKYLDFPKEFLLLDWGVVYRAKGSNINTILDLEGKTVSALKGSIYLTGFLDLVRQFNINVNILEMDQMIDVFRAVDFGKAEAGVTANLLGVINESGHNIERTPIFYTPIKLGYGVNGGKNSDLIKALDLEIAGLKADRSSIYYHQLENMLGRKDAGVLKVVYWIISGIIAVLLIVIAFVVVLKRQIRRKTSELSESENHIRTLIHAIPDLIWLKDINGVYLSCNKKFEQFFGAVEADIIGKTDYDFVSREQADYFREYDRKALESGESSINEEWITFAVDGSQALLETIKAPVFDISGKALGVLGIARDITWRKQVEERLSESNAYLDNLFNYANAPIIVWNPNFCITRFNHAFECLTGFSEADVLGKSLEILFPPDKVESSMSLIRATLSGERWQIVEIDILHRDKSVRKLLWNSATLFSDDGLVPVATIAQGHDITLRKQFEQELKDKNERLERFNYTISHDLKSPLITIQYFTGQVIRNLEAGLLDDVMDDLNRVSNTAAKMTNLITDLLNLSHIGSRRNYSKHIDMERLVNDSLAQLTGPIRAKQIEVVVNTMPPLASGDRLRIDELVQNLIENAIKYMGEQVAPRIEIGCREDDNRSVYFVKDNGKGIDLSYQETIFGLFSKIDSKSEGTGIGLALVKQIVEAHGGRVWVESDGVGHGSCFCFTLPGTVEA